MTTKLERLDKWKAGSTPKTLEECEAIAEKQLRLGSRQVARTDADKFMYRGVYFNKNEKDYYISKYNCFAWSVRECKEIINILEGWL